MSEEIGLIYINLSQLLDDICLFLRDGVNKEVFSSESQRQAEMLIKRSKIQLQHISNITEERYLRMDEPKKTEDDEADAEEDEDDEIYMDADEDKAIPVEEVNETCPFASMPAKNLPHEAKAGYIYMKTKFIFGFEKLRRIYAAIHGDWFLVYNNDKDIKPCNSYSLRMHNALMIPTTKQGEHETQLFALIHQDTKQKWQFLAQTHKDMLQWITRINRYHQNDDRQPQKIETSHKIETSPKIELPVKGICISDDEDDEEDEQVYDALILQIENDNQNVSQPEEDDEIYEVIMPQIPDKNQHIPISNPLSVSKIPARRQQTPLPPLPVEKKESSESLASYDNPVAVERWEKKSINSDTPSFSDDEALEVYDVLVTAKKEPDHGESRDSIISADLPKREEIRSQANLSFKQKLLQFNGTTGEREKPLPPRRMYNSTNSPTDQMPLASILRNSFKSVSPNSKPTNPKPGGQPKPSFLEKPKIDVKIIKPSVYTKSSTKQVMKQAKEISWK